MTTSIERHIAQRISHTKGGDIALESSPRLTESRAALLVAEEARGSA